MLINLVPEIGRDFPVLTGAEARIDSGALRSPFDFAQGGPLKRRSSTVVPAASGECLFGPVMVSGIAGVLLYASACASLKRLLRSG